jgi:DNA-nicking Smr family endonuclease
MPRRRPVAPSLNSDPLLDAEAVATLDLHGFSQVQARAEVRNFLASASRHHRGRVVHIITGRGKRSANGSVLHPLVARMLKSELRIYVADHTADLSEGGFLVLVR